MPGKRSAYASTTLVFQAATVTLLLALSLSAPAAAQVRLIMGTTSSKASAEGVTGDKFAELVKQKTNGEVTIEVHYGSLGAEAALAEAVMSGAVDFGNMAGSNATRFSNAYLVFDLPFLFKNYDNMLKALDGPIGRKAIAQFEADTGLKVLMPISLGSGRDIQTRNKQLKVPADIKGLKIRAVATPVDVGTFKAWGANPTPLADFGQLYTALQQGVLDGEGISIGAVLAAKHYEVIKYNLRIDYQMLFTQLFVNAKKFSSLSAAHQKALLEAAEETKQWEYAYARTDLRDRAVRELGTLGVTIYTPTPEEYAQWASIREQVWKDVAAQLGARLDLNLARQLYEQQD
jgi:tripartite ATP-independent transporter DctP family solute receptor